MSLMVYRGDLPRTKLEKLQRYKLKDILNGKTKTTSQAVLNEPDFEEYQLLKTYIESEKKIQLKPTDHIETDLGFDSLDMVSLEGFISNTFGTEIKAVSFPSFKNIEALADYIAERKTRIEVESEDWHTFLNSDASSLELPKASLLLPTSQWASKIFFKLYHRMEVKGAENLPLDRPCIIAPNHQSFLDGPLVAAALPTKVLYKSYFYAKEDHVKGTLSKAYASHTNIILMERSNLRNSILKLSQVLRNGKNLIIFPEGSRTKNGKVGKFKKSFAILSEELQIPIIPVRISGAYESLSRNSAIIKPHKIVLEFLPAVIPEEGITYDELSEKVRNIIANY